MEIKWKVKDGKLVAVFPLPREGLKEEEIEFLKQALDKTYIVSLIAVVERRVLK